MRHFISTQDWSVEELQALLSEAAMLKRAPIQPLLTEARKENEQAQAQPKADRKAQCESGPRPDQRQEPDHRHRQLVPEPFERDGGRAVAGDDERLGASVDEDVGDLEHVTAGLMRTHAAAPLPR